MKTRHRQVPVLDFECDEEIAELIQLMNTAGVPTIMSCQDNKGGRSAVRRVWVEVYAEDLLYWLQLLDRPGEAEEDVESLSSRIGHEFEARDWREFRANRQWHYDLRVDRFDGKLVPLTVGVRFPYTDLDEVTVRMRSAVCLPPISEQ